MKNHMLTRIGFSAQISRFIIVGVIGFIVEAIVIAVYVWALEEAYGSRLLSFPIAVTVTWLLNRVWTFRSRQGWSSQREYASYLAIQIVGALINYLVFAAIISVFGDTVAHAIFALAVGSIVAALFNFFSLKFWVFDSK